MSSDGDSTHGEQRRTAHARDENLQSQTDHAEKHTSEPHATLVKRGLGAAESGASSKNAETHAGDTSMSSTETNADSAGVDRDVHTTATNACVDAAQHEPKLSLHVGHFASFTSEADDGEEQIPVDVHIQTDNEHSNNGEGSDSVGGDGGMECAVPESASNTEVGMTEVVDEIIAEAVQAAKDGNKERYSRDSGPEDEPEDGTEDNVRASTNNPHVLYDDNQGAAKSSPAPPRVRTPVDLSHLHSALSNSIDSSHPTHTVDSTRVPGTLKGSVTSGHAEKMGDTVQKGSAAQALPGDGVVSAHRVHMDTGSHTIQQGMDKQLSVYICSSVHIHSAFVINNYFDNTVGLNKLLVNRGYTCRSD
ncbi:hypothetical protein SARC_09421 [Sphaeroforma arctica JP610]|uniref:Uncharacterized protein n=1 Tax=Sphaeroforma arctica JP610 TaxID=667725 RepID=A0A0L0FQ71_9EUKA|nr:hypothetical protein SARC_09421 [Sphaeroforma arctica JP610]KNC78133.1 hypothetical protein SARC_09421 [Sphaeroforma arctica JP610]|eukprot:XP_014152035.1 hypothetical protein SARC_09421 [Sphaeroforma arctica JP610]